MSNPVLALTLYVVYLGAAFIGRSVLHYRATGSTGFHGVSGKRGSAQWAGGMLFIVALVLGVAAPLLGLGGVLGPVAALDTTPATAAGAALALLGTTLTIAAQSAMGSSWRIGVDARQTTRLVTDGPFAIVRNPVFAAMIPTAVGLALITPNVVALVAVATLAGALQLQTRVVEEPHLLAAHGSDYTAYAADVGRFFPGVGKLRAAAGPAAAA